ncbi:response regulator [Aliivibrio finisterrensis]|uniref:Response regulator n=1 Tax=Aliivibrio finisterrensis TaxID=511998 RepID=A0A6N6RWB3_9GAMM|nr:response regulator [Aliivibrio finisterrensis]KAB2826038.1 response regulator [Aliivibrio finisterrensis]
MHLSDNVNNIKKMDSINILIIDNCQVFSLSLSKMLMLLGFKSIHCAYSYQQAIRMCSKKHYSILFIDYHLEQDLNGSELYDLLKDKGFIESCSRLITISGDNTTQTVLSTLSKGNGEYLCKPVSKAILNNKMVNACQEYKMFSYLYNLKKNSYNLESLKAHTIFLAKSKNINELDQFLFDLFTHDEKDCLLKLCNEPEFVNRRNYILKKLQLEADLNVRRQSELIESAESLCRIYPLFPSAFDFLSRLQTQQSCYEDALFSAHSALELTPSIPHRALNTLKLALTCNNKVYFIKSSHLLANHLPIADPDWCSYIAECFNYYDSYIQNCQSEKEKNNLLIEQQNVARRFEYRLTETQKKQLLILLNFSKCKRLIMDGDIIKAKKITLKSIQPFFDDLHRLNSVILIELLYLLSFFGELWLIERVNFILKTKNHFNIYCKNYLNTLKEDVGIQESILLLSQTIIEFDRVENINLSIDMVNNKLNHYQNILIQFPYSSEIIIGILECYVALSIDNPKKTSSIVSLVQGVPLSKTLMERRDKVLKSLHVHDFFIKEQSAMLGNSTMPKKIIPQEDVSFKIPLIK